jgi:ABC-type dipeptide/oligopeptide/nickel transport system permease subunit
MMLLSHARVTLLKALASFYACAAGGRALPLAQGAGSSDARARPLEAAYVEAVEALGGSSSYNMFRTVLPNAWSPILVQVVILSSVAILIEASLAFLGVGIPPPTPSWGEMLRTGKSFLHDAPTYAVFPGLVLTFTILSLDTLGRTLAKVLEDRHEVVDSPGGKP